MNRYQDFARLILATSGTALCMISIIAYVVVTTAVLADEYVDGSAKFAFMLLVLGCILVTISAAVSD